MAKKLLILLVVTLMAATASAETDFVKNLATIETMQGDSAKSAITKLMNEAKNDTKLYKNYVSLAEEHLAEPTDSLHNEELYIAVLENAISNNTLSNSDRVRPRLLLENALKNRIDSTANDIEYTVADGTTGHLLDIKSPLTLIYFNDPDCEACHKVKQRLAKSQLINTLIQEKKLTVIAIYPFDNVELWGKTSFPANIINARDAKSAIEDDGTYDLPSMPVFYLLDKDKKVLMKNEASLNRIEKALTRLTAGQ
jgi:protein-disulfide isomerase